VLSDRYHPISRRSGWASLTWNRCLRIQSLIACSFPRADTVPRIIVAHLDRRSRRCRADKSTSMHQLDARLLLNPYGWPVLLLAVCRRITVTS
jgi:hypothetical protein